MCLRSRATDNTLGVLPIFSTPPGATAPFQTLRHARGNRPPTMESFNMFSFSSFTTVSLHPS
jgi:hypothetical protein